MEIKALIIDDEPLAHRVIIEYAKKVEGLQIVGQCYKATDAYHILNTEVIDLLFLDINMPKLKGLDFLRTLEKPPMVIVTSAYEEYALEGYELQVKDYLLKPFAFDRFASALNNIKEALASGSNQGAAKTPQTLSLKVDKRLMQLDVSKIQYFESYGNYVKVWIEDKALLTLKTLSSIEDEVASLDFMRIHKSFIVQKSHVDYLESNNLCMKNGNMLPIGKAHKKALKSWLQG